MHDLIASARAADVAAQVVPVVYPAVVPGRTAHIDADFMAYQVSAESADELSGKKPRKTLEDMQHNAKEAADHLRRLCGAEHFVCHITPSGTDKGRRAEQAVQQEYQASRQDREKPDKLDAVRGFIGEQLNGAVHLDQEADDGLAQANYDARDRNLSVIVSKDKDLRMVPGLHWDFDSETIICVGDCEVSGAHISGFDMFGEIWIDRSKSSPTMKGWGTKFFWAQCLMGDAADYIKGLPQVPGKVKCEFAPITTYTKAVDMVTKAKTSAHRVGPMKIINVQEAKTSACGAVITEKLLEHIHNDKDAFNFVRRCWVDLEQLHGYEFRHWQTDVKVSATQALLGDMQLLWMRRNKNPLDVVDWIKEILV